MVALRSYVAHSTGSIPVMDKGLSLIFYANAASKEVRSGSIRHALSSSVGRASGCKPEGRVFKPHLREVSE